VVGADRPPAEALVPVMLDPVALDAGQIKLSEHARGCRLGEERCPKRRHLLAATFRTPGGVWVLARSGLGGPGWAPWWWDGIAEPAAMRVWCRCHSWTVDLSDFTAPHVVR
jgi:hypothetical protein